MPIIGRLTQQRRYRQFPRGTVGFQNSGLFPSHGVETGVLRAHGEKGAEMGRFEDGGKLSRQVAEDGLGEGANRPFGCAEPREEQIAEPREEV